MSKGISAMNAPATDPPAKNPNAKTSAVDPAARPTRADVARGLLDLLMAFAGFFLWPLYVVVSLAVQIWTGRSLLFSFQGRLNRALFWICAFIQFLYSGIATGFISAATEDEGASAFLFWSLIGALVIVPVGLSVVAVAAKRLHDQNRSAWWLLLLYVLPAALIGSCFFGQVPPFVYTDLPWPFLIWAFVALGCRRGTAGPNRFGQEIILDGRR
jgi:uncharacterized membrane protein YhaH (DUF805 family)